MIHADEEKQVMFIDRYLEEGLKIDYWWMDAGWYVQKEGWPQTGTWEVDPKRFPGTCRHCALVPLCRIHESSAGHRPPEENGDGDE